MNFLKLFQLVLLCGCLLLTQTNAGGACRGKTTCRGLRECAPVMSLIGTLQKPLKPSVVQFLRAQQCGFADGQPKICCGVLPRNLKIFTERRPKGPKLNRVAVHASVNKLSVYQPEPINFALNPHFDITVSTAAPGASTVPYLYHIQRDRDVDVSSPHNAPPFLNIGEGFKDAIKDYMDDYDLQRTRRSRGHLKDTDADLDIEVR